MESYTSNQIDLVNRLDTGQYRNTWFRADFHVRNEDRGKRTSPDVFLVPFQNQRILIMNISTPSRKTSTGSASTGANKHLFQNSSKTNSSRTLSEETNSLWTLSEEMCIGTPIEYRAPSTPVVAPSSSMLSTESATTFSTSSIIDLDRLDDIKESQEGKQRTTQQEEQEQKRKRQEREARQRQEQRQWEREERRIQQQIVAQEYRRQQNSSRFVCLGQDQHWNNPKTLTEATQLIQSVPAEQRFAFLSHPQTWEFNASGDWTLPRIGQWNGVEIWTGEVAGRFNTNLEARLKPAVDFWETGLNRGFRWFALANSNADAR